MSSWELNVANPLLNFCVGVRVGGHPRQTFHADQKMRKNISHFVIPITVYSCCLTRKKLVHEKLAENNIARGLKLRGFRQNRGFR